MRLSAGRTCARPRLTAGWAGWSAPCAAQRDVAGTGEVVWLVDDALRMEVPVPVIGPSVMQLMASRDQEKNWARAIAMTRHGFGGHPYGSDKRIVAERRGSRIGGFAGRRQDR
jgi:hypothetical protein